LCDSHGHAISSVLACCAALLCCVQVPYDKRALFFRIDEILPEEGRIRWVNQAVPPGWAAVVGFLPEPQSPHEALCPPA